MRFFKNEIGIEAMNTEAVAIQMAGRTWYKPLWMRTGAMTRVESA